MMGRTPASEHHAILRSFRESAMRNREGRMIGLSAGIWARPLIAVAAMLGVAPAAAQTPEARTPIKHVLLIIGENRSFDHLFGLDRPSPGQSVFNLLSQQ